MNYYLNPSVTVRQRGVMEKCTFCVQRIHAGEDKAKSGRPGSAGWGDRPCLRAGLPVDAIIFGDLSDPESRVSQAVRKPAQLTGC